MSDVTTWLDREKETNNKIENLPTRCIRNPHATSLSKPWQKTSKICVGYELHRGKPKLEFQGVFVTKRAQLVDKSTHGIIHRVQNVGGRKNKRPIATGVQRKYDRTKIRGGGGGNNNAFLCYSGSLAKLEATEPWTMFEGQGVNNWRIRKLRQLMLRVRS